MESAELRYNCLELAHRLKPGTSDITTEAQTFIDFVEGSNKPKSDGAMVLIDRKLAEEIASERTDMVYDSAADAYKAAPAPVGKDEKILEPA